MQLPSDVPHLLLWQSLMMTRIVMMMLKLGLQAGSVISVMALSLLLVTVAILVDFQRPKGTGWLLSGASLPRKPHSQHGMILS